MTKMFPLLKLFYTAALVLSLGIPGMGQNDQRDLNVYSYWPYYGDVSNTLYQHLAEKAFAQLDHRQSQIRDLETRADWENRQAYVRQTLEEIVGPFPERTPLNPVITGTLNHEGMVIEKLYFESRPGYYVTAIFCYPENRTEPLPAILFCSGHAAEGFRSTTYQTMIFNYAKKGFAVLAFDPIGQGERIRYLDESGKPRLGSTIEHSYPGSQSFLVGISPANFFIWDGIRAVDYLMTREEVDPQRIGITGRSGGGTQTAYIAAMDERIHAAAPECYITTFDKLLKSKGPQDAEQNLKQGIAKGIDLADYIEVRAPKPTLLIGTTRDIFSIQGFRDVYQEAQKAYAAWDAEDNLEFTEDDAGHASTVKNREATYRFFRKHLNHPGPVRDEEVAVLDPKQLWVLPTGNVYRDLGGEDIYSLTLRFLEENKNEGPANPTELREKMIQMSGYEAPDPGEVVFSGRTHYDGYAIEKYLVQGSGSYYLPLVWIKPESANGQTILWVDTQGKKAAEVGGPIDFWLDAGFSVVVPDLSGIGELGDGYKGGDARIQGVPLNVWYAGILTGKSIAAVHAEEIALLRQFMIEMGVREPALVGHGPVGAEVLQAKFMGGWPDRLVLIESLEAFQSLLSDREYDARFLPSSISGGIQWFDLSDLVRYLGPDAVLAIDPVDGQNQRIQGAAEHHYLQTSGGQDRFEKIARWLD